MGKQAGTSEEDETENDSSSKSLSSSLRYVRVWFTCSFNMYILPFTSVSKSFKNCENYHPLCNVNNFTFDRGNRKRRITSTCEEAADGNDSDYLKSSTSSLRYVICFMDDNCNLVIC